MKAECIHFDGGVCYAKWEPTPGNPTGFYGEGCELNTKDSCKHYKPVDEPHRTIKEGHLKPFNLMPAAPGKCQVCAVEHDPAQPHNQQSLFYQYNFYNEYGRWPTWSDAMAHCSEEVKAYWTQALKEAGVKI